MSFFKSTKSSAKRAPLYPQQKTGAKFMESLLGRSVPDFPVMDIPGMTDTQMQGQNQLSGYVNMAGMPQDYETGMSFYRDVLNGSYDPIRGSQYQGYRDASAMEEEAAVNRMQGRAQQMGMSMSSPAMIGEGMTRRGYSADRMNYLGNLQNQEQNRRMSAGNALMQGSDYASALPVRQAAAANQIGNLPREVQIQQNEALYNAIMQELLFPYESQSKLANALMSFGNGTWQQEGGPSEWSTIKSFGGDIASIIGGLF
jgi:hypothetical protein